MLIKILVQLLHEYQLAWGFDADPEDDLVIGQTEQLPILDQSEGLAVYKFARELGQIPVVAHHEFPECFYILELRQLLCCRSLHMYF